MYNEEQRHLESDFGFVELIVESEKMEKLFFVLSKIEEVFMKIIKTHPTRFGIRYDIEQNIEFSVRITKHKNIVLILFSIVLLRSRSIHSSPITHSDHHTHARKCAATERSKSDEERSNKRIGNCFVKFEACDNDINIHNTQQVIILSPIPHTERLVKTMYVCIVC